MADIKENMYAPKQKNVEKLKAYLNKSNDIKEYIEKLNNQLNKQ